MLWNTSVFPDFGAGAGAGAGARLGNFWKRRTRVRRLKNYLKYFYLYFLYIFTIKIFLKNTLYVLGSQNKERRRKETQNKRKTQKKQQIFKIKLRNDRFRMFGPHSKIGCFGMIQGRFRPVSAAGRYALIRPIRPDSISAWFKADFG